MREINGVKMIPVHLSHGEGNFLDHLQGESLRCPETNFRMYPHLHAPMSHMDVQEHMVRGHHAHGGNIHPEHAHLLESNEAAPLVKQLGNLGRHGDDEIAWLPEDVADLFDHIRGKKPSINPHTGFHEYFDLSGMLSGAWNSAKNFGSSAWNSIGSGASKAWNYAKSAPGKVWDWASGGGKKDAYSPMKPVPPAPERRVPAPIIENIPHIPAPEIAPVPAPSASHLAQEGRPMDWANKAGEAVHNAARAAQPYIAGGAGAAGALGGNGILGRAARAVIGGRVANAAMDKAVVPAATTAAQFGGHFAGTMANDMKSIAENLPKAPAQMAEQASQFFNNPLPSGDQAQEHYRNALPGTQFVDNVAHKVVNNPYVKAAAGKIGGLAKGLGGWAMNKFNPFAQSTGSQNQDW